MTKQPNSLNPRPLFGGAILLPLPPTYLDASDMRQIPDNQEVFLSSSSTTSLVVEVLEMVDSGLAGGDLYEAAKYHFDSLAHDNTALSYSIITPPMSSPYPSTPSSSTSQTPNPTIIKGLQTIHKYTHNPTGAPRPGHEDETPDEVWIGLALWRCWVKFPDGREKKADLVCSVNVNLSDDGGVTEREEVEEWWARAVGELRIEDWGLFADQ